MEKIIMKCTGTDTGWSSSTTGIAKDINNFHEYEYDIQE